MAILMTSDKACQTVPLPLVKDGSTSQTVPPHVGFVQPVRDGDVMPRKIFSEQAAGRAGRRGKTAPEIPEAERLAKVEQRWLRVIQWIVYGGVILLTLGAGALSWSHLTHVAEINGHVAPVGLLFLFPTIIDGFMALSSAVVVRHAITDERGGRTWYAGSLAAATATLSILLNIQDATGDVIVPAWALPGIAPTLYLLGTELGLTELRRAMRKLRARVKQAEPAATNPLPAISKKEVVQGVLHKTQGNVREARAILRERGVQVDRSYVYEIKRKNRRPSSPEDR